MNERIISAADIRALFKTRKTNTHKGNFGYVALVGGSVEFSGAIRLASIANGNVRGGFCNKNEEAFSDTPASRSAVETGRLNSSSFAPAPEPADLLSSAANSAVRSGAGVVTVSCPAEICHWVAPQILEATLHPFGPDGRSMAAGTEGKPLSDALSRYDVICFGMGIGKAPFVRDMLLDLLRNYKGILVLDADGLNAFSDLIREGFIRFSVKTTASCSGEADSSRLSETDTVQPSGSSLSLDFSTDSSNSPSDAGFVPFVPAPRALVLTPHFGEYKRLCAALSSELNTVHPKNENKRTGSGFPDGLSASGTDSSEITEKKSPFVSLTVSSEEFASNPVLFAERTDTVLLLKGPNSLRMETLVTDGKTVYLSNTGSSGMSTGGSGDVLSGIIGALLGQFPDDVPLAVAAGAYINGLAGELAQKENGPLAMTSGDTAARVKEVVRSFSLPL